MAQEEQVQQGKEKAAEQATSQADDRAVLERFVTSLKADKSFEGERQLVREIGRAHV